MHKQRAKKDQGTNYSCIGINNMHGNFVSTPQLYAAPSVARSHERQIQTITLSTLNSQGRVFPNCVLKSQLNAASYISEVAYYNHS
jgi:hypothetical protein